MIAPAPALRCVDPEKWRACWWRAAVSAVVVRRAGAGTDGAPGSPARFSDRLSPGPQIRGRRIGQIAAHHGVPAVKVRITRRARDRGGRSVTGSRPGCFGAE